MNLDDVKRKHAEKGGHFFDAATMRFFDSRIESDLIGDRWFVTSEQFHYRGQSEPRRWTIHAWDNETGKIDTVGEFQQYGSLEEALAAIPRAT